MMIPRPWGHNHLFVLVTGANSGVGLGICQRLIDEFLASRPPESHLFLIPTTRSVRKSRETIELLREHVNKVAWSSRAVKTHSGRSHKPQDTIDRIRLFSIQIDLCDLPNIYAAANQLLNGTISDPTTNPPTEFRVPRLDAVVFNAGFGGWTGIDWPGLWEQLSTEYVIQATTWPIFKIAEVGAVVNQKPVRSDLPSPPPLGEVFCANVFGHYLFAHELMPLLSRASKDESPGRIIWTSSVEPQSHHFRVDDIQGLETEGPYESSKRLTDIMALTSDLPGVKKNSDSFFQIDDPNQAKKLPIRPVVLLTHPGVVASTLFPLNWMLYWLYVIAVYLSRWLGSPWHPVGAYGGACAPAWAVLQTDADLDELHATRIKWGSSCTRLGYTSVKKTEVEGWGWEGKVEDRDALAQDHATGLLRKTVGRKWGALDLTEEKRQDFESLGAKVWQELEKLRRQWERTLDIKKPGPGVKAANEKAN